MPDAQTLVVFSAAALVLLATPGPAIAYVVARSLSQGAAAGVLSSLGLCLGLLIHVGASVSGLSAILAGRPLALQALQLAGAGYLLWLGVSALRASSQRGQPEQPDRGSRPLGRLVWDGFVINLLNPKVVLFFLAFLPQFAGREAASELPRRLLALGVLFVLLAFLTNSSYALIFGRLGQGLQSSPRAARFQDLVAAGLLLGLGVLALVHGVA